MAGPGMQTSVSDGCCSSDARTGYAASGPRRCAMSGSVLMCAVLACGAAPIPAEAPPPRVVRPEIALVVSDLGKDGGPPRMLLFGFRGGKPLPPEILWENKEGSEESALRVVADRYGVFNR